MDKERERFPYHQWLNMFSRLPAKSLTRFRCVAKPWNILISDSNFVELHRSRSMSRPGGTSLMVAFKHASSKLFVVSTDYEGTPKEHLISSTIHDRFSQIVNGLVCLIDNSSCNNRIILCNICTREFLPLPSSNLNLRNVEHSLVNPSYLFGFDPVARVYKVLNICSIVKPDDGVTSYKFEIFTLGVDESWRAIKPPQYGFSSFGYAHCDSICVNGCVYWIQRFENYNKRFVELFNMKDENFFRVRFPSEAGLEDSCNLIRINRHLVIAMWPIKQVDNNFLLKLWVLQRRNCGQHFWNLETIVLPEMVGFSNPYPIGSTLTGDVMIMDNFISAESKMVFYDMQNKIIKGTALFTSFLHLIKDFATSKQWSRFTHNMFKEVGGFDTFKLSITDSEENVFPLKKKR